MGIRGLETFLEKHCSEACYSVNIAKLVSDFKCRTDADAKIVVDAQSCYRLWYRDLDWLSGFAIQELTRRLRTFVEHFKKLGVQLIFFFGDLTPEKKRKAWLLRRKKNLEDIHIVFDILKKGRRIPQTYDSIPLNMGITTSYILKFVLDCEVHMSIEECDEEIIDYVHKHGCFAIFGQDSDFVISQVDALILSSKNFNTETMTTLCYDGRILARHLRIQREQLPLLALLGGNDLIPFNTIREFHHHLCSSVRTLIVPFDLIMPAIGRYINDLPKDVPLEALLERIAEDLFRKSSPEVLQLLRMSYESYFVRKTPAIERPEDDWSRILYMARYRHKNSLIPNTLYAILSRQTYECNTVFEDLRTIHDGNPLTRDQPSSTVTRLLRSRLYGILLFEKEQLSAVQEWCGENTDSYSQPVIVEPIKPSVRHPGLMMLWSENNSVRVIDMRWKLFLSSVCPSLKLTQWQSVGDNSLLAALSVYYLYNVKFLDEVEVDAVLATIATHSLNNEYRVKSLSYDLDFRAAHISVTLIRTYGIMLMLLAACGYPIPIYSDNATLRFEGKLFQKKYAEVMKDKLTYRRNSLCEDDANSLTLFYKMRDLIIGKDPNRKRRNRNGKYNPFKNVETPIESKSANLSSSEKKC